MLEISTNVKLCMNYAIVHANIVKKIDVQLGVHGISFSEFMILYHLQQAPKKSMRRIDLAERVALSASGITRSIAPMEKIGLVRKEANKRDARVSLVRITPAGERVLEESYSGLDVATQSLLSGINEKQVGAMLKTLGLLGGDVD